MDKIPICYVDDNESHLTLFEHAFSNDYDVTTYDHTIGVIDDLAANNPKLIVLDVNMPSIDGYQFCEAIRKHDTLSEVPVVFLSCMRDVADRLKGYEAGGDCYVTKPYDLQELKLVIKANLARQEKYEQANQNSQRASAIAFDSMRNNSELGELIQFARGVSKVRDEGTFIRNLFSTLNAFDLEATVLIRLVSGEVVARTDSMPFNLMEKELLELAQNADRITAYGKKYLFSGKNTVLLIKNMPVDDEAMLGRLKDHLAILIESAEACVEIINGEKQRQMLLENKTKVAAATVNSEFTTIIGITDQLFKDLAADFEGLCEKLEQSFIYLDLTEEQEQQIMNYTDQARRDMDKRYLLKDQLQAAMVRISDSVGVLKKDN
ncbi:MAG: response regulator [Pseudomonadales bacterium]|nr:response regulator [Pseudomonadales bacterium]